MTTMTSRFLPDADCMVAAVSAWHDHSQPARREIARRRARGETMIMAAHALIEAYAVLTRLPAAFRLTGPECHAILEQNFIGGVAVVALDSASYLDVLRDAASRGILGGQVYDAVIAACARAANVNTLLTFNERHFRRFAGSGLAIVVPAADEH